MDLLSFIVWSPDPAIFRIGGFEARYYGLLFALGFVISQQIMYYIFKKEGRPESEVDTLTFYMIAATIIGARLGHVFFYEPDKYLANPLSILKVWEGGLASHGAAAGILFALWLYSRKMKTPYLWILDRIVIVVAITGALIRTGNFMNSEIIGKPTETGNGVVFMHDIESGLLRSYPAIQSVETAKGNFETESPFVPVNLIVYFQEGNEEAAVRNFVDNNLAMTLRYFASDTEAHIHLDKETALNYQVSKQKGKVAAIIQLAGIPRHPAQLYEAISCVFIFLGLFWLWNMKRESTPQGIIFGIFLIVLFGLRFLYEFLKENQVGFENELTYNMGQLLSIPLVLAGVIILIRAMNNFKNGKA